MTREGRHATRRRVPFLLLWLVTAVLAVVSPRVTPARAEGNPGGPAEPPPPDPLVIPASWYDTIPAASVDYLPASGTVTPSGQFALSIPIDTPPARGMGPSLAFSYAGAGDGLLGVGWTLGGLSAITRCRKTLAGSGVTAGIHYLASDQLCLDEQPLVVVDKLYSDGCKEYRTERDGFARIVGCGQTVSGPLWFRVWTKAGQILLYEGVHYFTNEEAELDAADVIPAWPLRDAQDRSGNLVRYTYEVHQDDGEVGYYYRPLEIEYTRKAAEPPLVEEEAGLRKVVFDYEPRPDPSNHHLGGMPYGMPERLSTVRLIAPNPEAPEVVARYELSYEQSSATGRSLLTQIRRCDGAEGLQRACLWAKQLTWWQSERPDFDGANVWTDQVLAPEVSFFSVLDADGDGKDDLLAQLGYRSVTDLEPLIYLFRGSGNAADHGFLPPILVGDPYSYTSAFHHVDLASSRPADLDGDGKMELLAFLRPPPDVAPYVHGFQWFRWNEDALIFEPFGDFLEAGGPSSAQLGDFDGDGLIDMLRAEPAPAIPAHWLLHRNTGGDLSTFQATDFLAFEPGRAVGIDVDGDGRSELFAVDPVDGLDPAHLVPLGLDDAGQFGPLDASWVVQSQGPYALSPVFADITGDGLRDALFLFDDPKQVRINAGRRFLPPAPLDIAGQLIDTSVRDNGVRTGDFDGDNREDLLTLEAVNAAGEKVMRVFLSRSGGFVTRDLGVLSGYKAPEAGWATTKLGDFNGDGWLDIARMPAEITHTEGGTTTGNLTVNVLLQKAPAPGNGVSDLLFEVKDEDAPKPRQSVFYTTAWGGAPGGGGGAGQPAPTCTYPQLCLRRGFPVVQMTATYTIEPAATRWTFHEYHDPRVDLRGRGFLGFGSVRTFDPQLRIETTTTFDHHTRIGETYPFAGLPQHTVQIVPLFELPSDGTSLLLPAAPIRGHVTSIDHTYNHHLLNGGATYYTPVATWSRTEFETDVSVTTDDVEVLGPGGPQERRTEGTMVWDDFGNPTYDLAYTWGGSARLTQHTYDNLTADWQIGLLRRSLESAGDLGNLPDPREVTFDYDARGRLWKTTIEPGDPALFHRIRYFRNDDGLVEKIREIALDEPLRHTYFAFDDKERMFVRAVWNDLGHARRMVTHPALGATLVTDDPNGVQVRRRYDSLGRTVEIKPDGAAPIEIQYAADTRADPAHPRGLAITEASAGAERTTYLDEHGRAHESATLAFDGQTIVHRTDYSAFGYPVRAYRPGFGAPSALFTETSFDTLGRVVNVTRPNGDKSETVYSMFEILQWDFDHHLSRLRTDQDGRAVESASWGGHWITTRYEYGDFGALTDVWDAEDNHTELQHDRLGRRTMLHDPDLGISTYHYNGFGELEDSDDGDPSTPKVVLHRDVLGRVTGRQDGDGKTSYTYDAPGALGKPWTLTSPDGVTTVLSYDVHGRPWKTKWTLSTPGGPGLGDGEYEIERSYDPEGRVAQITYPEVPNCAGCPRFATGYTYTPTGYLHEITDMRTPAEPPVLWQVAERNADDQLVKSRWAPGITVFGQGTPTETRGYDPILGRLDSIVTTVKDGEIFHLGYGYDANGNVTSRADPLIGRTEIFDYDAIDRLKTWTLTTDDKTRIWSYGYDDLHNLETVHEDGVLTLTHAYGAVAAGAPKVKPHALDTISGAVAQSYHYDARGRQIEGGNRGITWTDFDLPKRITHAAGATEFEYDALGTRVRKTLIDGATQVATASTVTLGGLYERRQDVAAGTIEHVFYLQGEGGPVAQITYEESSGEETARYLQHDGLGSVALVMDGAGTVHDRRFFEPFGQRIDANGGPFSGGMAGVELGFSGHRHDGDLGLIDMRGRVYDPLQKHFLSPDPLIGAPLSGHDLNRYSYAWNNPLSIVDPTGLQEAPGGFRPPTQLPMSLTADAVIGFFKSLFSSSPTPTPPTPTGTKEQKPGPATSDGQGAKPPTGSGASPTPQELPPGPTPRPRPAGEVDENGFVPYNAGVQRSGGFVAGVSIGLVPFGSLVANALIAAGVLVEGTPEAREGLANGQLLGGLIGMVWGSGKSPSAAPVQAPRPMPATAGGGSAPPLVVVPNATGVLVGAGGVVTLAVAVTDLGVALTDPGKQQAEEHHIATDKNKIAGQRWTDKFEKLFDKAGVSLQDPRNKVAVVGHKGPHPELYHQTVYDRLSGATYGLTGAAARDALLKQLDILGQEVATPGTVLNNLVTKGSP